MVNAVSLMIPPSDDSCTDIILGECDIFTEESPGLSDADNFTHCLIEYKILESSQHEKDPALQLGKPVPGHTHPQSHPYSPKSGYQSLMDASTVPTPVHIAQAHFQFKPHDQKTQSSALQPSASGHNQTPRLGHPPQGSADKALSQEAMAAEIAQLRQQLQSIKQTLGFLGPAWF